MAQRRNTELTNHLTSNEDKTITASVQGELKKYCNNNKTYV